MPVAEAPQHSDFHLLQDVPGQRRGLMHRQIVAGGLGFAIIRDAVKQLDEFLRVLVRLAGYRDDASGHPADNPRDDCSRIASP
jgi:hypothetical protein